MSEIEDRRQRAREAFYDRMGAGDVIELRAVEAALEVATQVKITDEALAEAYPNLLPSQAERATNCLKNALTALGFEVVD